LDRDPAAGSQDTVMLNRQALNIVANFSGVGARLIFSLGFNIAYFRMLGSESYGLIGFYASLAALSSLFDLGLNQTTVREVARRGADGEHAGELRAVVFTLQLLLGGIGLLLGLLVALSARWIAASWFSATQLAAPEITASVALMGGAIALLFPANVFYGTLIGLQRQVLSNTIIVAATALRGALTVIALLAFGPSPVIFFSAQIIASALEVGILCFVIRGLLPPSSQWLRFDAALLRTTWKFSWGTWLAVTFGQIAMLGDKIILSTLLPLHLFGLYSLAVTVTSSIQRLAAPFTNTYFPHFVRLKEQDGPDALLGAYRLACELASAIFLAAGLSLVAYTTPVAHLLSTDPTDIATLGWPIALLAAANTLNVEMALPFSLLFAHGITAVALRINLALCVLYPAALVLLVPRYGIEAAAGLWLAANALMLPVLIVMTHRLILPGQALQWLLRTVLLPGCGGALALAAGAAIMPDLSPPLTLIWIGLNGALALAAALLGAPETRKIIFARLFTRLGNRRSGA
jgi:O-antigen/teichoic acid export membrane protein